MVSPFSKSVGLMAKPQKSNSSKVKSNIKSRENIAGKGKNPTVCYLQNFLKSSHFFPAAGQRIAVHEAERQSVHPLLPVHTSI